MQEGFRFRLKVYGAILAMVVIFGTLGLIVNEGLRPFDAIYFVIVTVATVGFGDIVPHTTAGRVITIVIILAGVSCFVALAADIVEHLIGERERTERLRKMNMLIGVFFSECGTDLLRTFSAVDPVIAEVRAALVVTNNWSPGDFASAKAALARHPVTIDSRNIDLPSLHAFLTKNKSLMVAMLENPHLIEQETFTELMQALFHLAEELRVRSRLTGLPETDYAHLSGDINRVYGLLIREWLAYMQHLKANYPYLFSLAMRTNPFDANASPIVV